MHCLMFEVQSAWRPSGRTIVIPYVQLPSMLFEISLSRALVLGLMVTSRALGCLDQSDLINTALAINRLLNNL